MSGDSSASVLITQHGPIRVLTLNRPQRRNALDPSIVDGLYTALADAEEDADTRCIVLAGNGKSFCAGADLRFFLDEHDRVGTPIEFLRRVSALVTRLETSPLPVVAAVHGHAVAGGLELALGCDVVIAADSALIGDGHVKNNLLPAGGSSVRLSRKVGDAMARWMSLTGELLPAGQLHAAGWLHAVVPESELENTAISVATQLASRSGPAQSAFKSLLFELTSMDPRRGLEVELESFDRHWKSDDVPAALRAFLRRSQRSDPRSHERTQTP